MRHPGRVPDIRELLVPGTPYIVVYRMRDRTARILSGHAHVQGVARFILMLL